VADSAAPSLFDLYKLAIDEYHFQVTLNWNRTQYYLGLNVAIIGAGTGILKLGTPRSAALLTGSVFAVGVVTVVFSLFATGRQHAYYRATRDRLKAVEAALALDPVYELRSTEGLKGVPREGFGRRLTVTNVTYGVFAVLGAIDFIGVAYVATR
jgi:hypothetical protein